MKRGIFFTVGLIIVVFLNAFAFAQKNHPGKYVFDIKDANQSFASIQKTLETRNDYAGLVFYTEKLDTLQDNAKRCVSDSESHLKIIGNLLQSTELEHISQLQRADYQYLEKKQKDYARQLSECRLFVYRSQEALMGYKDLIQNLSANQILKRGTPIWKIGSRDWTSFVSTINFSTVMTVSGINKLSVNEWIIGFIFVLIALFLGGYLRLYLKRVLETVENAHLLWRGLLSILSSFIILFSVFGFLSVLFNLSDEGASFVPTIELMIYACLVFVLSMAITKFLFYPSRDCQGLFLLPVELGRQFYRRITLLFSSLLIGYIVAIVLREQTFLPTFIDCVRTLYITLVSILIARIFLLWHRSPFVTRFRHMTIIFFSTVFVSTLCMLVVIEWLGYHRLAVFSIKGLCFTALYTIAMMAAWRFIDLLYQWIDNKQYTFSRKVHQLFGMKFNKKMHEITLIKFALQVSVFCLYIVALLKSWSISANFIDTITDGLLLGFKFLGVSIFPLRIILALVSFSAVLLLGKFWASSIAQKQHYKGEEDTQIAISTILVYISFAVALVFSLFVTGVDFTGLAIVAGALSVGVGLGLQTIVNNFVSGLILLIEKPIKPGDRIVIGKTEGFVRKIRIRSTQISTLAKEDVIVPNADLITNQVTNYMFRDRNARVQCEVGVAYGSDLEQVKKILLDVAAKHPDVIHEAPNNPTVLFKQFGESALIFNLWCVIHDVNKKYMVVSDLNFAIDAAFREHQISIAFPQRDVHIKETGGKTTA